MRSFDTVCSISTPYSNYPMFLAQISLTICLCFHFKMSSKCLQNAVSEFSRSYRAFSEGKSQYTNTFGVQIFRIIVVYIDLFVINKFYYFFNFQDSFTPRHVVQHICHGASPFWPLYHDSQQWGKPLIGCFSTWISIGKLILLQARLRVLVLLSTSLLTQLTGYPRNGL